MRDPARLRWPDARPPICVRTERSAADSGDACPNRSTMLVQLAIRDIVLIDRLDLAFDGGLSVLTGETGAGKSILLDAFALALGARGDAGLVRHGADQGQITAVFDLGIDHPARALVADGGIEVDGDLILRRVQLADGRTRAFVNDQAVSVQLLRALGASLVEIHGQHDDRALVDPATHRSLLDAYGGLTPQAAEVARLYAGWRAAEKTAAEERARLAAAEAEADFIRHAVKELTTLAPVAGEETALAERRASMMRAEKVAQDLGDAHGALSGPGSPVPALAAAARKLERRGGEARELVEPALAALDQALRALDEAQGHLEHALQVAAFDPRELERIEERLFALRAAGRKYAVPVDALAARAEAYAADLEALDRSAATLKALDGAAGDAQAKFRAVGDRSLGEASRRCCRTRRRGAGRAAGAEAGARALLHRDHLEQRGRARRLRCRRLPGADQSRHQARGRSPRSRRAANCRASCWR